MKTVTLEMLKSGSCYTSRSVDSLTSYKKGDELEVEDSYAEGMIKSGKAVLKGEEPVAEEPKEPEFDLAKAKKPELVKKAAELGIDPTISGKDKNATQLRKEIGEALQGSDEEDGEGDIDLDAMNRKELEELVNGRPELKEAIVVEEDMTDDELRDDIAAFYDGLTPNKKVVDPATETK